MSKPDLSDLSLIIGLIMLFVGIWQVYPPAALIVVGALLVSFGFWSAQPLTPPAPPEKLKKPPSSN